MEGDAKTSAITLQIGFLAALWLGAGPASAEPPKKQPGIGIKKETFRIKDVAVPSKDEYVTLAKDVEKRYLADEFPMGKEALTALMEDERPPDPGQLTAGAAVLLAFRRPVSAAVLAARAAWKDPTDALIANNLGAVLNEHGETRNAVAVLGYARGLEPKSPLILTNLAIAAMEASDLPAAAELLDEAIRLDPARCAALEAKAVVLDEQKRTAEAREALGKSLLCRFTPVARRKLDEQRERKPIPPPPPPKPTGSSPPDGTGSPPAAKNTFPWPDLEQIAGDAGALTALRKGLMQQMQQATKRMTARISQVIGEQQATGANADRLGYSNEGADFLLREFRWYYRERFDELFREADGRLTKVREKNDAEWKALGEQQSAQVRACGAQGDFKGALCWREKTPEWCKQRQALADANWRRWRAAAIPESKELIRVLDEQWNTTERLIDNLTRPLQQEQAADERLADVAGALGRLVGMFEGNAIAVNVVRAVDIGGPKCEVPEPPKPQAPPPTEAKFEPYPCPIKGTFPLPIPIGPLLFTLTFDKCDSIELKVTPTAAGPKLKGLGGELGVQASLKFGFKDLRPTTTTFFIGVKNTLLKAPDGLAVAPNWEAVAGVEFVIDRNGNLQSAGLKGEQKMSMRAKVGDVPIDPGAIKQSDTLAIELGVKGK